MKVGLKLATVAFPIPTVYWVMKGSHPRWVKAISLIWAIFTFFLLIGASQSQEGLSGYPAFIISSLFSFAVIQGGIFLFTKAIQMVKSKATKKSANIKNQNSPAKTEPHFAPLQEQSYESTPIEQESDSDTLTPRRQKALYKLALQILEDDEVDLDESKKLRAWLRRYPESKNDARTKALYSTAELVLEDKVLDDSEALEIFALLTDYCDNFEKQEAVKEEIEKQRALKERGQKSRKIVKSIDSNYSFLNELRMGQEYFMSYKDASGDISERNIVIQKVNVNKQDQHYIKAHCLLRNSQRTFRADRIVSLCDVDTGESYV